MFDFIKKSFLYHRVSLRDSNPRSWSSFSWDVPWIAPVMARRTLYWTISIILQDSSLLRLSLCLHSSGAI